jgi:tRNA threonylcarbamoyladenosine biosynthesis protein TsaB
LRLLALDTCLEPASVAIGRVGEPCAVGSAAEGAATAEALVPLVQATAESAGSVLAKVQMVAVTTGPGGFTGVRIGIAAARALALAAGAATIGVGTLEALAEAARRSGAEGDVLALKDVRRGEVMVQRFDEEGRPSSPPRLLPVTEALAEARDGMPWLVGDGVGALGPEAPSGRIARITGTLAEALFHLAARRLARGEKPSPARSLRPLYHRPPDARPGAGAPLLRPGA